MTGIQESNIEKLQKIETLLNSSPSYMRSFSNFMQDTALSTKIVYLNRVNEFIRFVNKPLKDLTVDDYTNFMASKQYKNGKPITSSYRIQIHAALKYFSSYLYTSKICTENYMQYIHKPKKNESQETIEKRKHGYLTQNEIKKVRTTIKAGKGSQYRFEEDIWLLRDYTMINLFLVTGIRRSALRFLDVGNVNFNTHQLVYTDKGNKVREVDLSDETIKLLQQWIEARSKFCPKEVTALFISNRKQRISDTAITSMLNKYTQQAIQRKLSPHKLRATYGTQLYNATKDIVFVKECMGHNSTATTELYIRDSGNTSKRASDVISKIVNND